MSWLTLTAVVAAPNPAHSSSTPGDDVGDVLDAGVDCAAEQVDEQQHQHDGEQQRRQQRVGVRSVSRRLRPVMVSASPMADASLIGARRCARSRVWRCQTPAVSFSGSGRVAVWPVRARNTSSSVAVCTANLCTAQRWGSTSSSSARTCAALPSVATPMVRRLGSLWTALAEGAGDVLECRGVGEHEVQALLPDLPFELGRGAPGDHASAVDDGDSVGEPVGLLQVLGG
jgi:hypothetical protein